MLLIRCLTSITSLFFLLPSLVSTLPVPNGDDKMHSAVMFANKPTTPQQWPSMESTSFTNQDSNDFYVDLNRFTQLLSTHIMTEHLESAMTALSKKLASQVQDSIELITHQQQQQRATFTNVYHHQAAKETTTDDVDVRLLKEQLQGAVGSYVEDQLPSLWYNHRSFVALDSISLRSFMEKYLLAECPASPQGSISHRCLQPLAIHFSSTLDTYVKQNMQSTLVDIVQQDLPQLMIMTDNHVRAILNHFNTFLLPPRSQLRMNLVSVQDHQDWSTMSGINTILGSIADGDTLVHSIQRYALLAKSTATDA